MAKFCLINNLYKPYSVGGAEKYVEESAKQLVRAGNEAVIITSTPFRGWKHKVGVCVEDGIKVYRVWIPNIFWYGDLGKHKFFWKLVWHFIDIFNFWGARIIKRILQNEKPAIVEIHNLMGLGYLLIKRLKDLKIKYNCYLHDVQLVEPSGVLPWNHEKDKVYQKIYSWVMKWRMGRPDEVVCLSEFMKEFYQNRGFFKNSEWRMDYRLQTTDYRFINRTVVHSQLTVVQFLFVGSLVEHKGIRVLMRAWENVRGTSGLAIVGDGILFDEIKKWAKNYPNVKVHGRLEAEELEKVYQESDVLIFPSICIENRPTVVLEAKKYGLKIIASDTGGVGEFVGEEDALVEPNNAGALTKAIKCAII